MNQIKELESRLAHIETRKANAIKHYEQTMRDLNASAEALARELEQAKAEAKAARKLPKTLLGFTQDGGKMTVTFGGWDGKSYDGEGRSLSTWTHPAHPGAIFVKTANFGGCFHKVTDELHEVSGLPLVSYHCCAKD